MGREPGQKSLPTPDEHLLGLPPAEFYRALRGRVAHHLTGWRDAREGDMQTTPRGIAEMQREIKALRDALDRSIAAIEYLAKCHDTSHRPVVVQIDAILTPLTTVERS